MCDGGIIDYDSLSQEDIIRFETCRFCHKKIEIIIKLEKPITLFERMRLSFPVIGEIILCKECANKLEKNIQTVGGKP